jgi:hypothetical protein
LSAKLAYIYILVCKAKLKGNRETIFFVQEKVNEVGKRESRRQMAPNSTRASFPRRATPVEQGKQLCAEKFYTCFFTKA